MKKILSILFLSTVFSAYNSTILSIELSEKAAIKSSFYFFDDKPLSIDQITFEFDHVTEELRAYANSMKEYQHDANKTAYAKIEMSEHPTSSNSLIVQNIEQIRSKQTIIKPIIENFITLIKKLEQKFNDIETIANNSARKLEKSKIRKHLFMFKSINLFLNDFSILKQSENPINQIAQYLQFILGRIDNQNDVINGVDKLLQLLPHLRTMVEQIKTSLLQHKNQITQTMQKVDLSNDDKDDFKIITLIFEINQIIQSPHTQPSYKESFSLVNQKLTSSLLEEIITHFDFVPYNKKTRSNIKQSSLKDFLNPRLKQIYSALKTLGIIEDGLNSIKTDPVLVSSERIIEKSHQEEKQLLHPLILSIKASSSSLQNLNNTFLQNTSDLKKFFDKTKEEIRVLHGQTVNKSDSTEIERTIEQFLNTLNKEELSNLSPFSFSAQFHQTNIDFVNNELMIKPINRKYMNLVLYMIDMKLFLKNIHEYVIEKSLQEYKKIIKNYQRIIKIIQFFQNNGSRYSNEWRKIYFNPSNPLFEAIRDIERFNNKKFQLRIEDESDTDTDTGIDFRRVFDNDIDTNDSTEIDQLSDQELIKRIKYLDIGRTIVEDIQSVKKEQDILQKLISEDMRLKELYKDKYGETGQKTRQFSQYSRETRSQLKDLIQFKKDLHTYYKKSLVDQDTLNKDENITASKLQKIRINYNNLIQYKKINDRKEEIKIKFDELTGFVRATLGDDEAYSLSNTYQADFVNILVQGINSLMKSG